TKLLRHTGIVSPGPIFDDALSVFNKSLETDLLALWTSQREDHTSDWLQTVPISGLGQTMNACSRVFAGDIYGDHAVSCVGIIGIKDRHNVVRDTLVDICYRSRILAGKKVDIGLDGGRDKPLRLADMLLYLWDGGLDVCVDLTGSSPLTQTGMVDFVPSRAVIDDAQRKREADAVTLLKRICKFSMTQDIGARVAAHIFNRISFAIAKGMALWQSQMEDHTSDWLRVVLISGLGQTMNACSKVFTGDIYGDHAVSCAGIIGIKHRHNVVRDTLVDICFRSGISAGKEVDIGLGGGCDKPLRPADINGQSLTGNGWKIGSRFLFVVLFLLSVLSDRWILCFHGDAFLSGDRTSYSKLRIVATSFDGGTRCESVPSKINACFAWRARARAPSDECIFYTEA
ncbi:hypothetical protein Tco_1078030, partial [Tanacetum coccineum]